MGGSYTNDEQAAAKIAGGISDTAAYLLSGTVTKATASTTAVVTHSLGVTPDFCIALSSKTDASSISWAANTTTLTFTRTSATAFTVSYIAGYTS